VVCAELDAKARLFGWLRDLNTPDETPKGQDDGLGKSQTVFYRTQAYALDPTYAGLYALSTRLKGAHHVTLPGHFHGQVDLSDLQSYLSSSPLKVW